MTERENKLLGKKWKEVPEKKKEELLKKTNVFSDENLDREEDVILDLTENLSIGAKRVMVRDDETYVADDEAVIYCPL